MGSTAATLQSQKRREEKKREERITPAEHIYCKHYETVTVLECVTPKQLKIKIYNE